MRLEISGGPLGVKFRIQGHLGVGKGEKHPLGQNCPKADATVNVVGKKNFTMHREDHVKGGRSLLKIDSPRGVRVNCQNS